MGPTWGDLLDRWPLIECDLHETYGIDTGDDELMRVRRWPWLRTRILGLLECNSRLWRSFAPVDPVGGQQPSP